MDRKTTYILLALAVVLVYIWWKKKNAVTPTVATPPVQPVQTVTPNPYTLRRQQKMLEER